MASQTLDEYTIGADIEGNVVARANQVDDYRYRPRELENITLWDFCAQIDKVLKRRCVVFHSDDGMSDSSNDEIDDDDPAPYDFGTAINILEDDSRRRPTFTFLEGHVEHNTRYARVRHPMCRVIPTLVGQGLPRRDRMDTMARHARAVLLLFKPWRHARDLRNHSSSWTDAYNTWLSDPDGTYPQKQRLIDNIQSIQECKDARDHHRAHRSRRGVPVRKDGVPGELCINDEQENLLPLDFEYEETDGGCLRFLSALEDCRSYSRIAQQDASFDCIDHLTRAGRFSASSPSVGGETSDVECEFNVSGTQLGLEDEWRAAYSERLQQSKQLLLADTRRDDNHDILPWENVAHDSSPSILAGTNLVNAREHIVHNVPIFRQL